MSFLKFFKRKPKDNPSHEAAKTSNENFLRSVGVNNDADAEYRERQIARILEETDSNNSDKILEVVDKWTISRWSDKDDQESWLANPVWDDEGPVHRQSFANYSEAREYILGLGGVILDSDPVEE